jgi:hypothetical protein
LLCFAEEVISIFNAFLAGFSNHILWGRGSCSNVNDKRENKPQKNSEPLRVREQELTGYVIEVILEPA